VFWIVTRACLLYNTLLDRSVYVHLTTVINIEIGQGLGVRATRRMSVGVRFGPLISGWVIYTLV